jgi:hypothetical protein
MSNSRVEEALNVLDLRQMAKARLPKWLFEFVGASHIPAAM